ncbi:hypothetical protein HPB51_005252 [Rhipicephalus microplus]|uniref:Uncharacterized protein n=1 Tax=Rhipicephalus microplus TaxID=6941 RepID=A0A9J6DZD5_RHIMP|nr:hypothetical protein HPB51_005252 [Rhipicephalus microplus]
MPARMMFTFYVTPKRLIKRLANAALNLPQRTVYHWHSVWREACFDGTHIDPVLKLEEKASLYAAQVLIHKEQSNDGYLAAFKLLKEAHPLCFGGQPVQKRYSAGSRFSRPSHTDSPGLVQPSMQLSRRSNTLVMYADTAEKLEAATAELKALQHEASVSRVRRFLRRQEEWVQLYHLDVLTRGHNTNNFEEATIRVLKDIILNRVEDLTQSQTRWLWCGRNTLKAVSSATPTALLHPINCCTSGCCRECQKTQPRPSKWWARDSTLCLVPPTPAPVMKSMPT